MGEPRPAIQKLRKRKERHQQRGRAYRISFAAVGFVIIFLGLLLSLPGVPGPGLLVVAVGLGMLALEFDRAERLLERIIDRVESVREGTSTAQQVVFAGAGVALVVAFAVALFVFGVPATPW